MTRVNAFIILTVFICQFINQSHQNVGKCVAPRLLNGGYRVEASFVILVCDDGYQLVGPKQIKCIRRTWNPSPTTARCERMTADVKENNGQQEQYCSAQNLIENGNIEPEKRDGFYEVGDMIVVRCNIYYKAIPGETSLQCLNGPQWSGKFPVCEKTCEPLENEKNGEWKLNKNQNTGELDAVFVCNQGQQLVRGLEGKTCIQGNRGYQWIGEDPQCRELEFAVEDNNRDKTCPQPALINNGQVFPNKMGGQYFVGEQINVECNPTFHPVGGSTALHCTDEGKWSDEFPECKALTCLIGSHPDNGIILELKRNNQVFNFGDVIRYQCEQGYRLNGEQRRLCGVEGWSSSDPKCELVACGDVPVLEYSRPKDFPAEKKFIPGEELEVECLFGFQRRNQQRQLHLFCNENGQWDTTYAECQSISCENPPAIANAVYEKLSESENRFYYGDEILYTCLNDLVLMGKAKLTCSATGWSDNFPSCQAIYCDQPDLSDGVRIQRTTLPLNSKGKYQYRTEIFYECEKLNYDLSGSLSQTCTQNGWSGRTPFCRLTGCLEPKTPDNGRIYQRYKIKPYSKFYTVGDYVVFTCNWGYSIDTESHESERSHCTADGTWTTIPRCIEIYCELPGHPENGEYLDILPEEGARYPLNYDITFKCNQGYQISASTYFKKRQCSSNGRWSNYQPICTAVTCTRPPDIPNAVLQTTISEPSRTRGGYSRLLEMKSGFETTYKCREGHHMIPRGEEPPVITCLETGLWSEPNFECQSSQCGSLPIINNGYLSVYYQRDYYPVGSRAGVVCYEGFRAAKEEVTCQPNGWDVEREMCQGIYKAAGCGPVPQIQHGSILIFPNDRLYTVGTMAPFYCEQGFTQNTYYIMCLENGNWNVTGTECETKEILCGRVPIIQNGIVMPPSGMRKFPIGTQANVICNKDFRSNQSAVICGNDGNWDIVDVSCNQLVRDCGTPPRISKHGYIVDFDPKKKRFPPGHSITYACDPNYTLVPLGYENNACTTQGWLHVAPQCVAEWCDPIPELENGYLKPQKSGKMVPNLDKLEIVCNAGFASTKDFLQCNQEGQWSTDEILCERDRSTDCDRPEPFENGYIENISDMEEATYPLEHPIRYKCRENYLLDGDSTRFCSEGGWSGESPVCKLNSCKIPKRLSNTEYDVPIKVGEVYIQRCPPGQGIVDGNDAVECLEGGKWNRSLPRCEPFTKRPCPKTEFSDDRGRFVPINPNTIRLICSENYIPLNINVSTSTCNDRSGTWNIPHDMACVPLKPSKVCSEPGSFDHGTIVGLKDIPVYKEGDNLTISCDKGYSLAGGSDSVTCLASGYWDGVLASCIPIECEIDQNLPNGEFEPALQGENLPYNKVLNVKCKLGYQILQKGILRCSETGWDGPMPSCKKIKCSDPGIPENGWYHVTSFDYGERVTFGCFSGYKLYGSKERVCLGNGKWSGPLTVCDAGNQDCPDPGTPLNGLKSGVHYNNGDIVKYSCLNGYTLMGSRSRTCKDRSWTGQEPECIGKLDYDDPNDVSQRLRFLLKQMNHVENTGSKLVEAPKAIESNRRVVNDPKRQNSNAALIKKSMLIVCFLFDSSSTIGDHNFEKSIKLAQALIGNLNITKNETRSCVLVFNSEAKVEFTPSEFRSTAQIIEDLNTIRYEGAKGKSLFTAFKTFEEGILNPTVASFPDRQISFLTFLFTDGKVKPDYKLHKLVGNLRRDFNLKVYCVALTGFPNKDVLFSITSSYRKVKRIFFLDSYSTMDKITKDLIAGDEIDYSVCGKGFDSSLVVEDLSTKNTSDTDHSTLQLWPWTVQLMKVENSKSYLPTCLGSLVNKNWVLTSGHCFPKDVDPRRILTKTGIENYHLSVGERIVHIEKNKIDNNVWSANAALIKLKKPVTFSEFIHPVCLPAKKQNLFRPHGQQKSGYSISWAKGIEIARNGNLAQMHMTIQNKEDCAKSLNEQLTNEKSLDSSMFCASDSTGSLEVCGPDLGSPLYQFNVNSENQAQWVQIGIASAFEYQLESETSCVKPSRFFDLFLDVSVITQSIKNIINT